MAEGIEVQVQKAVRSINGKIPGAKTSDKYFCM